MSSNITTSATAADDYTPIPIQTTTDAFEYIILTATIITSATDASTPSARLLYAIQIAAARVSTAADDNSATTTRLLLAIHLVTAKNTPAAAGESTPADLLFVDTTDPHHDIVAVSTTTTTTYHHIYSIHVATIIHGNTYLHHFVLLLPHVAAWAARYSAPSSIYDGALTILVQPSFTLWREQIQKLVSYPCQLNSEPFQLWLYFYKSLFLVTWFIL